MYPFLYLEKKLKIKKVEKENFEFRNNFKRIEIKSKFKLSFPTFLILNFFKPGNSNFFQI